MRASISGTARTATSRSPPERWSAFEAQRPRARRPQRPLRPDRSTTRPVPRRTCTWPTFADSTSAIACRGSTAARWGRPAVFSSAPQLHFSLRGNGPAGPARRRHRHALTSTRPFLVRSPIAGAAALDRRAAEAAAHASRPRLSRSASRGARKSRQSRNRSSSAISDSPTARLRAAPIRIAAPCAIMPHPIAYRNGGVLL